MVASATHLFMLPIRERLLDSIASTRRFRWEFRVTRYPARGWHSIAVAILVSPRCFLCGHFGEEASRTRTSHLIASLVRRTWPARAICVHGVLFLYLLPSLSLYLFRRRGDFYSFLLVLIARGKYRDATRAHLASLGARADAVSHIRMLLFLVTRRGESRSTANSPTLARVTYVPRH